MFAVAIFVLLCAHAVHPSTVVSGHAITNRGSDTDHAAEGAAVAGDTLSGHAITKRGSETDYAAQGAAAAGDTIAVTGGVIAAGSLKAGPFAPVVAGVGGATAAVGGLVSIISRAADQSCRDFGCHNNYCFAYCSIGNQWCYTTKSYSQSFDYVSCTRDDECNGCWKCAGSCTL
ncbi:unnamed protein product [Macrosiphum euphorbiae]|uniref:Uncharacterized protein n=1 Tax=Macrosiphum euphorbiae TaxID=13131 RepID=A0AAV0VK05_9HEMI|nr:unnamed protein product [Macrosiphum euphorbiae]